MAPPRILIEGRPGAGKTTVAAGIVELLRDAGVRVQGVLTRELRDSGRRVGFEIESVSGERGTLAHVRFPGPPRVGRYGVDLEALERVALPALRACRDGESAVIDELGKTELASAAFRDEVAALFGRRVAVVATVMSGRHPFTDELKRRDDVVMVRVTLRTRDALPGELTERIRAAL